MKHLPSNRCCRVFHMVAVLALAFQPASAQNRTLVWSDEFEGPSLDTSTWSFQLGQFNDCVHYSTDRTANTRIADGKLQLIALKESYKGYNYTASVIKTKHTVHWRYGRIEARIKLPGTNGFVPAFWLLPEDERYGWWPASGEIDVMEYPTNQPGKIYGTVHTAAYNLFTGSGPRGSVLNVPDAESAFHVYAIEWSPDKIDFFVDETKYFTFHKAGGGSPTWPFDQPFYIILNMAVGGGWVGNPTSSTVFPALMEVDYVRVYQQFEDIAINGPAYVKPEQKSVRHVAPLLEGATYEWSVPNTAKITSGQNTRQIQTDWGIFGGTTELLITANGGSRLLKYPVEMSDNLLKNASFEQGSAYWDDVVNFPAERTVSLSTQNAPSGDRNASVEVRKAGANPWDVQLSQTNLSLKAGQSYQVSFWARSETGSAMTAAVIHATSFTLYAGRTFSLTPTWKKVEFSFTAPASIVASFNLDLGAAVGKFGFDDFRFAPPPVASENQIRNADFSTGESEWELETLFPAVAADTVKNEEYAVSITNGGVNAWDIHAGQEGAMIETGKEYVLSFDAYASSPRLIYPLVGKNADPWTVYSTYEGIPLSTNRKSYAVSFVMTQPTDTQARLGFDLGGSSEDVFLDNVFLSRGQTATDIEDISAAPAARSIEVLHNWPNPFQYRTTIAFTLSERHVVSLRIYDMVGRVVETLLENELPAGEHHIEWDGSGYPSGTYFVHLSSEQAAGVRAMTVYR